MLFLFLAVNFAISWFNAWSVGRSWAEAKAVGGFPRLMAWMGACMSACGFTWCYSVVVVLVLSLFTTVPPKLVIGIEDLSYLVIILPVIGSGFAITVQSWAAFWKNRTFGNGAVAGFNTAAEIYDIYEASRSIPSAFGGVVDLFKSDDDKDGRLAALAVLVVLLAVAGGVLTTRAILLAAARNVAFEARLGQA